MGWPTLLVVALAATLLMPLTGSASGMVDVTGTVLIEHGDSFSARRSIEYKVLDTGRERYSLDGVRAGNLREGQRVRVRGYRRGGTIVLASNSTITDLGTADTSGSDSTSSGDGATVGTTSTGAVQKRLGVLLINFVEPTPSPTPTPDPTPAPTAAPTAEPTAAPSFESTATAMPTDTPTPSDAPPTASPTPMPSPTPTPPPKPWTKDYVRGVFFTNTKSVAAYFGEVSNGRMSVSGEVHGWYTLTASTATCDPYGWATLARNAAAAAGVDLSSFTNLVYAFPKVSACPWGGLGQINDSYSWINGKYQMNLYVAAHELGHNFGAWHASTLSCTSGGKRVAFSSSCTSDEYGDPFDIMGGRGSYSSTFHLNSWHRRQVSALTTGDQLSVSVNGIYSVANAQAAGGVPRILRVLRPAGDYFYLEHRQPYGLFDPWSALAPVVNGVSIRLAPAWKRVHSKLIDTTPATTTFDDAALAVGRRFRDPVGGITITTLALDARGATLRIQVGPDTVAPSAPTELAATVTDPTTIGLTWVAASDDLEVAGYRVSRDGVQVATVTKTAFTDANVAQGMEYTYSVVAVDAAGNAGPAASVSRYLPDTMPPSAASHFSGAQTGHRAARLEWGIADDNIAVTGYRLTRDGVVLTDTPELAYDDDPLIDGFTYEYALSAVDAAGNVSAPLNVSLALPDVTPPSAPGTVSSGQSTQPTALVEWASATDNVAVTGYTVSRDGVVRATLAATATSFSEELPEGTYRYEVRAFDAAGHVGLPLLVETTVVTADVTAPSVPQGLTAKSRNYRYIQLSWQPSTDDRAETIRYALFRGTKRIALTTETGYLDRPEYVGTYKYKVRAIDAAGNRSAFSPVVLGKAVRRV